MAKTVDGVASANSLKGSRAEAEAALLVDAALKQRGAGRSFEFHYTNKQGAPKSSILHLSANRDTTISSLARLIAA